MGNRDDEILTTLSKMVDEQREHRAETAKSFSELDKKVDLHIQKTEYELKRINDQDEIQNKLLDQHIEGVNTLKSIFEKHEIEDSKRFQKIEEPRKIVRMLWKGFVALGAAGGTVAAIAEAWYRMRGH